MVTNQISPLGTQDFSQYLTNIANSGADVIINVNWGRDAVLSVQQAKQFGLTPKMKMVIPYQIPFLAKEVGPELTEGVYAATDFWSSTWASAAMSTPASASVGSSSALSPSASSTCNSPK